MKKELRSICHKAISKIRYEEPTILCILASAGVIGTAVLSAVATPKALKDLSDAKINKEWPGLDEQLEWAMHNATHPDEEEKEFPWHPEKAEKFTKFDTFCIMAPHYIPAAAVAIGTITCIFGANVLSRKQQASLLGAYSLLENSYKEYKAKVIEKLGEKVNSEIISEIEADNVIRDHYENQSELPLFYDYYGNRYFNMSTEDMTDAAMILNKNYIMRGYASLNEYYAILGLDPIDEGEVLGWNVDEMCYTFGSNWIDIEYDHVKTDDGLECDIIRFLQEPTIDESLYLGVSKNVS